MPTMIGWAKEELTIDPGTPLAGYEGGPPRIAEGVHDPLYIRAVTLEQSGRRVCVVACDTVAVDAPFVSRIAEQVRKWGIAPADFAIAATHCHSGPAGLFEVDGILGGLVTAMAGEPDRRIIGNLQACILHAVEESVQTMKPASLRAGVIEKPGIGTDRNDPARRGDGLLSLLQFETDSDEQVIVYSIACHPTVLHADNTLVSADFPGATARALEQGKVKMALFLNGAAGDMSTRFTRRSADFDEVERIGGLLARQVNEALNELPPSRSDFKLGSSEMDIHLSLRKADSPAQAAATLERLKREYDDAKSRGERDRGELRQMEARCEGAYLGLLYSKNQPQAETLPLRLQILRIGPLQLAFFPVELFSSLSERLRAGDRNLVPVSYANGYFGYLPDKRIENTDNYEKYITIFAYGQGEELMAAAARCIMH